MNPTPPGGFAATPDASETWSAPLPRTEAEPLEPLPRRVRRASEGAEAGDDSERVDEEILYRLLNGLREI